MNLYPISRQKDIVVQELKGEVLIYDLLINKAYCLNQTTTLIWLLCDGTKTVTQISQTITEQLGQSVGEDLVWLALDGLKERNLLFNSREIKVNFNGLPRREVIKKVGLGTMIALPLISSVVAPLAAQAASGAACLNDNEICNGSVPCCAGLECNPSCGFCIPAGGIGGCL